MCDDVFKERYVDIHKVHDALIRAGVDLKSNNVDKVNEFILKQTRTTIGTPTRHSIGHSPSLASSPNESKPIFPHPVTNSGDKLAFAPAKRAQTSRSV